MRFEYQIPEEEYVAAEVMYLRLLEGRKRREAAVGWTALGGLVIVVAFIAGFGIASFVLAGFGVWWIYAGITMLFPSFYIRRTYPKSEVVGKTYQAEVTEQGFEVTGDVQSWRVSWPGVVVKGEDGRVFMFQAANTLFIFGKRYLTDEQQQELRHLAGLTSV